MVTLDRWSVYTLSSCVHTLDQVELDSQHDPSNSSRVGFRRYLKSSSIHVLEFASTRISRSPLRLALCRVLEMQNQRLMRSAKSVLRYAICRVALSVRDA